MNHITPIAALVHSFLVHQLVLYSWLHHHDQVKKPLAGQLCTHSSLTTGSRLCGQHGRLFKRFWYASVIPSRKDPFSSDQGSQTGLGLTSTRLSDRPGTSSADVFALLPPSVTSTQRNACCHAKDGLAQRGGGRWRQVSTTLPHTSLAPQVNMQVVSDHAASVLATSSVVLSKIGQVLS